MIEVGNVLQGDVDIKCPKCGHEHKTPVILEGAGIPSTSFPYAQKLFPVLETFGVGTAGAGQLNGKSIYFIMRQLERELLAQKPGQRPATVKDMATAVGERAKTELHAQAAAQSVPIDKIPDAHVQFLIVGFDGDVPRRTRVLVGADIAIQDYDDVGSYLIGATDIAKALFDVRTDNPMYQFFSLQDAVEYAEFLISATASHQRFYRTMPSVGGAIDVALVTPFDGFRWIRKKPMFETLVGGRDAGTQGKENAPNKPS